MRKVDFITSKSVISPKKSKIEFFLENVPGKTEKGTPDSLMAKTEGSMLKSVNTRFHFVSKRYYL